MRFLIVLPLILAVEALFATEVDDRDPAPLELDGPILQAPRDPARWPEFRSALHDWREKKRRELAYDDSLYERLDFAWTPSAFSCCFLMVYDELFYDHRGSRYTVDAYLDHGQREFGGFDAVVLWQAYPRIGFDGRNQFDFYRDMPGGLAGVRDVSRRFHALGVKVFVDYNPWDIGTRREGVSDVEALAELVRSVEADGIFLDTLRQGSGKLRASLDAVRRGVALESELELPLAGVHDHHMSWAQWFRDSHAPGVLRNKWLERRHLQHQIHRWNRDHTGELHSAWMNGSGMMVWENVFGSWVGWCERDRSILRAMLPIQRRYADLFAGEGWTPLVSTAASDVFASLWERDGLRLWSVVNRGERAVRGGVLDVVAVDGARYFDLVAGREVHPRVVDGAISLTGEIRPRGIGAFLAASTSALRGGFDEFLRSQARTDARARFDTRFPARAAKLRLPDGRRFVSAIDLPRGMVAIRPQATRQKVEFRMRECGLYEPQSDLGRGGPRLHSTVQVERDVLLAPYAIDLTPVTNAEFAAFLRASGYRPAHPENFLRHWVDGAPPSGAHEHPVVCVDLDDARAYARWAGKRLPTEEEWQYAALGERAAGYPWGEGKPEGRCNTRTDGTTTSVTAYPDGRSSFGCYDMCGNAWEWTESERSDGRTRFCILKGGASYHAKGSHWYADGGPRPAHFAAKFLLMWPGLDRCATIGFRCAVDVKP